MLGSYSIGLVYSYRFSTSLDGRWLQVRYLWFQGSVSLNTLDGRWLQVRYLWFQGSVSLTIIDVIT